jgi:hypothetical protein
VDLSLVTDRWDSKTGEWAYDNVALGERAAKVIKWLRARDENDIIVMTHAGTNGIEELN